MKYIKKFVLESRGVPKSLDVWVDAFYENIVQLTYQLVHVKGDEEYMEERTINGEEKINSYGVILQNTEYFDSTELFPDSELKLRGLDIEIELCTLPNKFINKISDFWEASYNDSEAKMKNGILYDNGIRFNIFLPEEIMDVTDIEQYLLDTNIKSRICSYISHELTHMYEFFQRKKRDKAEWKEMDTNFVNSIFSDYLYNLELNFMSKSWNEFVKLIYLSSGFEINARVVQVHYRMKYNNKPIESTKDFNDVYKQTLVYEEMKSMFRFDPKEWYENFEYDKEKVQEYLELNIEDDDRWDDFGFKAEYLFY